MTEPPLTAVIVPSRNRAAMLVKAVESVCRQTFTALEIIVVDDGSDFPLSTAQLPRDDRLRLLRHASRRGACAARNTGLGAARGDLVAFLDDDDEWLPGKLEAQIRAMSSNDPEVVLISCAFRVVSDISGEEIRFAEPPFDNDLADLLDSTPFPTSVPLIRRQALEAIGGFDESLEGAQDRDLWIRLRSRGEFGFTPELGVIKHNHADQISTKLDLKREALERFLEKHRDLYKQQRRSYAHQLARLGLMQCADGRRVPGALTLLRSALMDRQHGGLRDLVYQMFCGKRGRDAHIARAFRQLDGEFRYF